MMNSDSPPRCPECGKPLPAGGGGHRLCPACLMAQAIASGTVLAGDAKPGAMPPPSPETIADKFPQFELLECLGRGGMGVVYKARQKSLNRTVAIKILAPEREHDARFAARFAREAELLARLSHPHIVTIHDFGQADGLFYIVMEFVDGVNLRDLLREGKVGPRQALAIVPPVCEALQYAHDHGVVHRDIKPENLLLDREGRVKIADFGIASLVGAEGESAGTPPYMAPEQGGARPAADHRADIYALGVVLYEMLTGERPGREVVAPSRKVHIDVRLDEIVLRALEKQPEARYASVTEFRTQVETVVNTPAAAAPERAPDPEQARLDACTRDPANWRLFFLYFCRADPRIVVPRRISGLGWTLNFARPLALPFLAALVAFVLGLTRIAELLGAGGKGLLAITIALLVVIIGACHRMAQAPRLPEPAEDGAPAWKTYVKTGAWLLPLLGAWHAAAVFVLPKLNEVGAQSARKGGDVPLPGSLLAGAAKWSGPVLLSLAALVVLAEAGWPAWRRHRGRVLAGLAFGLGLGALAGLCLMILQGGLLAALSSQNREVRAVSQPLLRVTVRVLEVPAAFDEAQLLRPGGLLDSGEVKVLTAPYVVVASGSEGGISLPPIREVSPGGPVLSGRTRTLFVKPSLEPGTAHVRYTLEGLVSGVGAEKGSETRRPLRSDSLQLGEWELMESCGLPDGRRRLALISVEMAAPGAAMSGDAAPAAASAALAETAFGAVRGNIVAEVPGLFRDYAVGRSFEELAKTADPVTPEEVQAAAAFVVLAGDPGAALSRYTLDVPPVPAGRLSVTLSESEKADVRQARILRTVIYRDELAAVLVRESGTLISVVHGWRDGRWRIFAGADLPEAATEAGAVADFKAKAPELLDALRNLPAGPSSRFASAGSLAGTVGEEARQLTQILGEAAGKLTTGLTQGRSHAPGHLDVRGTKTSGDGVTLGFLREPGLHQIDDGGSRIEIAQVAGEGLTFSLIRVDGEKRETVALPEFVKGDGWFAYAESAGRIWIFDGKDQLDVLTPTGRYSAGDVGVRAFCPAVVWTAVPGVVRERLESGRPKRMEEAMGSEVRPPVPTPPPPETLSFGGVEWQAWRTLFEVRDGSLVSLPRVRPGFDYGHWGHGRGPEIITNIGNPDWRDYRIEARLRVPGVDPALNPHGLGLDFHGAMIAFHVVDRKESFNERGTSAYILGFEGEGNWSLAAHYNNYCRQPQGWGNWGGDAERKLASGSDAKLDREKGNRLRIELRGKHIQVWLDDRRLVDLVDEEMDQANGGQRLDHGGVAFVGGFDAMIRLEEFSMVPLE